MVGLVCLVILEDAATVYGYMNCIVLIHECPTLAYGNAKTVYTLIIRLLYEQHGQRHCGRMRPAATANLCISTESGRCFREFGTNSELRGPNKSIMEGLQHTPTG